MANRARSARLAVRSRAERAARGLALGPAITLPTAVEGSREIPVIALKYSDTGADPYAVADLQQELFDGPWPSGTMADYYKEISHGKFSVSGRVFNWVPLANNATHYVGPAGCAGTCAQAKLGDLVTETLTAADATVDFTRYDNDGPDGVPNSGDDDGFVDFVALVHPQAGGECLAASNTGIWSHRSSVTRASGGDFETGDVGANGLKIRIDDYVIMPALACDNATMIQIGVFAHEFGHAFGLPDLYDTTGGSEGIGAWGLMGSGSWGGDGGSNPESPSHMGAWSKEFLGWQNSRNIAADALNVTLQPANASPDAVKIDIDADKAFLIEFRDQQGFDRSLTGAGLLVWSINNSVITPGLANNQVNAVEANKGIGVVEADGNSNLDDENNRADAGDVFPGTASNTTFDGDSSPSTDATIALCNIRRSGTAIALDIYVSRSTCPPGTTITLSSNVLFKTGSHSLGPDAVPELQAAADQIGTFAIPHVTVHGHTDSDGTDSNNQTLSEDRANEVRTWFETNGALPATTVITAVGHGETMLVDDAGNSVGGDPSLENKIKSRRVEIAVVEGS